MSMSSTLRKNPRAILVLIIILAVLLRLAVALYLGDSTPPAKDETSYSVLATRLASGPRLQLPHPLVPRLRTRQRPPTSHWSFLYTAYAAAIYALFGVHPLAVRIITAILLPWMTYRLAQRLLPQQNKSAIRNSNPDLTCCSIINQARGVIVHVGQTHSTRHGSTSNE